MWQTDSQSLVSIIPFLLYLESHLQQHPATKVLTVVMLQDFRHRFATLFQPDSDGFNLIPTVACLLDPTVAPLLSHQNMPLFQMQQKMYIVSVCENDDGRDNGGSTSAPEDVQLISTLSSASSTLNRLMFLTTKIQAARESSSLSASGGHQGTILSQLNHYLIDICEERVEDGFGNLGS